MSVQVVVDVDAAGRLVAVKHGDPDALRREAEILAEARHPGVVELIRVGPDAAGELVLQTASVGPRSLATAPRPQVERIAGVAAATAATLADLHALGIVHGRLDPSHVLFGPTGRPVLCGFSGAGRRGEPRPPSRPVAAEFTDPASASDSTLSPAVDVFALGSIMRWLLADGGPDLEPIPHHRLRRAPWRSWSGWARRSLLNLADHAMADDPRLRPSAASLAHSIRQAVPTAALEASVDPGLAAEASPSAGCAPPADAFGLATPADPTPGDRRRRWGTVLTGAAGGLLLLAGASILHGDSRGSEVRASAAAATTAATSVSQELAGGFVERDGMRFEVGAHGDRVVVADWDCDGRATVALLRPATGEVFVFDSWATPERDLTATPTAIVAGGADLAADDPDGDGCSTLVVVDRDGRRVEVTT